MSLRSALFAAVVLQLQVSGYRFPPQQPVILPKENEVLVQTSPQGPSVIKADEQTIVIAY